MAPLQFLIRRFLSMVLTVAVASLAIFGMVRLLPGDIIDILFAGDAAATPAAKEAARRQLGLQGSWVDQYAHWINGIFHGSLGTSYRSGESITSILGRALPITVELAVLAAVIAIALSVPIAVVAARRRNTAWDHAARIISLAGLSVPNFWLATLLLVFTSRVFHWVPPLSYISFWQDPLANLGQFVLPAFAICVFMLAIMARMLRASLLEVASLDYVRTARAKGLPARLVFRRHVFRNALVSTVTVLGFEVGGLLGGAAVVETIFGLPGVGYTLLQAISERDYPLIQATTLVITCMFVAVNFLVDMLYSVLDPRISVA